MISDKTIDAENTQYWCLGANEKVKKLFNGLIKNFDIGQKKAEEQQDVQQLDEAGIPKSPSKAAGPTKAGAQKSSAQRAQRTQRAAAQRAQRAQRTQRAAAQRAQRAQRAAAQKNRAQANKSNRPSRTPRPVSSKSLKTMGAKQFFKELTFNRTNVNILKGTLLAVTLDYGSGLARDWVDDWNKSSYEKKLDKMIELSNNGTPEQKKLANTWLEKFTKEINEKGITILDQGDSSLDNLGNIAKTAGWVVGGAAALYALWSCRDIIKDIFTPSKKKKKKKKEKEENDENLDEVEFFLKEEDDSQVEMPTAADSSVAECWFTADGKDYEVKFNHETMKWNLTSNGEPVSNEEARQYFKTNHFKNFTTKCFQLMNGYLNNENLQQISPVIQKCDNLPEESKQFFANVVDPKDEVLDGLKRGVWENR